MAARNAHVHHRGAIGGDELGESVQRQAARGGIGRGRGDSGGECGDRVGMGKTEWRRKPDPEYTVAGA